MAQFDVYRVRGNSLVVDCQSDLLPLKSRFVVPLRAGTELKLGVTRLNPRLDVAGEEMIMMTHLARAIDRKDIIATVASLANERDRIVAALDVLITGV